MTPLETLVRGPEQPTAAVIWMHGLGADATDFEPLVPVLGLPHVRFVLPNAPVRPVTINGGYRMRAWYDILTMDRSALREDPDHIRDVAGSIRELIDEQVDAGIPHERIVLAGFSQGGAMALHVGLRWPFTLAGIMALSTYLVLPDTLDTEMSEENRATPMLVCHGTQDPMVPVQAGRMIRDTLSHGDREITYAEYPMPHSVCPEEVGLIRQWLGSLLPA